MKLRLFASCFAWLYLVAGLAHAGEPAGTTRPRYADVAVETKSLGSASAVVRRRVHERADVVLRRGAVLPARDGDDPVISVTIDELTGDDPGYVFKVEILRNGVPVAKPTPVQCPLCTEGELVDAVEGRLEHAVGNLPALASTVPPPRVEPKPRGVVDAPVVERRKPGMKIAGATLVGVGLGATIAGAVLSALEPKPDPDNPLSEKTTKPPGYALLGVGLGAAVTGAVLLIVDASKRKKSRSSTARRR